MEADIIDCRQKYREVKLTIGFDSMGFFDFEYNDWGRRGVWLGAFLARTITDSVRPDSLKYTWSIRIFSCDRGSKLRRDGSSSRRKYDCDRRH